MTAARLLPAWLGTKPLLYVIAALVLALVASAIAYERRGMQLDVAKASASSAMSLARSYDTERQAWKRRASEYEASLQAHQEAMVVLGAELQRAQADAVTLREQDARALAQARASAAEANRTLAGFMDRYHAQIRAPSCERALDQLEAACPALSPY